MVDPIRHPIQEDRVYADANPSSTTQHIAPGANMERINERRRQRDAELDSLRAVLATEAGEIVLMSILAYCKPYESTLRADGHATAAAEGERSVGVWLIRQIQRADPFAYPTLLAHHVARVKRLAEGAEAMQSSKPPPSL